MHTGTYNKINADLSNTRRTFEKMSKTLYNIDNSYSVLSIPRVWRLSLTWTKHNLNLPQHYLLTRFKASSFEPYTVSANPFYKVITHFFSSFLLFFFVYSAPALWTPMPLEVFQAVTRQPRILCHLPAASQNLMGETWRNTTWLHSSHIVLIKCHKP